MFININEPPVELWNQKHYVKSWLLKHGSTNDKDLGKIKQRQI